jgi:hypothetical protein
MNIASIFQKIFAVDSIWSIILRGGIWFVIAIVILISVDNPNPQQSMEKLKSNLGFFLMFLVLFGGLVYLLFGFSSQSGGSLS